MEAEAQEKTIGIERNSKPYLIKRLIADGFDTVLLFGLFMLFTVLLLKTPLADSYNGHIERYTAIEAEVKAAYGDDAALITQALNGSREYLDERFAASLNGYFIKAIAWLLAAIPVLLAVPFLNRDRATPGKWMTGIMPFHERRQRRAVWYQIFFRFLFVFLIDGMGLYLLTGIWTFVLVPVLRLIEILCSRKDKTFCDMMTGIMIIEKLSYSGINQ